MQSNYKPIGDYIRKVDKRNRDLSIRKLYGLSMNKEFRVSTSNIVGANMANYKVMEKYQFACDFMSPIRVSKLPVVLKLDDEPNLVSAAYPVFEVVDKNKLDPEYLMMWFRRPEFDRYATFRCDAAIRGGYDWNALCETKLPVPSIEKQRAIVAEYNTVKNRIALNNQLIQKLEETAQAIYKQWFVDFEFPSEALAKVGVPQPYKSSGGKMVWNEELEKEIPEGWEYEKLDKYVRLEQGQVINAKTNHLIADKGIPLLRITDLINETENQFINPELVNHQKIASKTDIIYSRTGQVGLVFRNKEGVVYNNCFKVKTKDSMSKSYIFWFLKDKKVYKLMNDLAASSAQPDLNHLSFLGVYIIQPNTESQIYFEKVDKAIDYNIECYKKETSALKKMSNILLSKLATIEN